LKLEEGRKVKLNLNIETLRRQGSKIKFKY
jgi:hypothetical protein